MIFIIKKIFKYLGQFGPYILILFSIYLLWNNYSILFYYLIGMFINCVLNFIIKDIIREPRPRLHYKNNIIPSDIYGMPSGHAQSIFFSAIFIYLLFKENKLYETKNNIYIINFYLIISILTSLQRLIYNYHTIQQIIIGIILGTLSGLITYYLI